MPVKPQFNERKATQLAGLILKKRNGPMHYMKLIKLMYLVDRTALLEWGRPVTFDVYYSLPDGPILSNTLDLINAGPEPNALTPWHELIVRDTDPYCVTLRCEPLDDELSEAEEEVVDRVYEAYGFMNRYKLRDLLHKILPEWEDPHGSRLSIYYRDILFAGDKSPREVAELQEEMRGLRFMDALIQSTH